MYQSARTGCVLFLALLAAGCAAQRKPPAASANVAPVAVEVIDDPVPIDWRSVITEADKTRLGRIEEAWDRAIEEARTRFRSALRDEGSLLEPAAALPRPAPPPGPYLCRVVKLGGTRPGYATFKPWNCYVEAEGELLTIVKQTGSKRPAGRLWADGDTRLVFLGALGLGQEDEPPPYAERPERDLAGYVERVAPFRWRLVVPFPPDGGTLDVYELVPIAPEPGGPKPQR